MKNTEVLINTLSQRGPKIRAGSVRVYDGCKIMRFSHDVVTKFLGGDAEEDTFKIKIFADPKSRIVRLIRYRSPITITQVPDGLLKVWFGVNSMYCAAKGIVQAVGLDPKKAIGSYSVTVKKHEITIQFDRRLT